MNIGNTIKKLRNEKGYKQNVFAAKVNLTQAYLSKIENNQQDPAIGVLKTIADALETPLPILFFHSLEEADIEPKKREAYKIIGPSIKSMIESFF